MNDVVTLNRRGDEDYQETVVPTVADTGSDTDLAQIRARVAELDLAVAE